MKVFISYPFDDRFPQNEEFVYRVSHLLRKQRDIESYCYTEDRRRDDWPNLIGQELKSCDKLIVLVGKKGLGEVQHREVSSFKQKNENDLQGRFVWVIFPDVENPYQTVPNEFVELFSKIVTLGPEYGQAVEKYAISIWEKLTGLRRSDWIYDDGLPVVYPFDYEKDIIKEYANGNGYLLTPERVEQGCPIRWPSVKEISVGGGGHRFHDNPLDEEVIGKYREEDARIIVDVRGLYHPKDMNKKGRCLAAMNLAFPEAGPRKKLCYPLRGILRVGIVVSGGIAPGINAVIAGIVKRHRLYHEYQEKLWSKDQRKRDRYALEIFLFRDGFSGLSRKKHISLSDESVESQASMGGSMISTSRFDPLLDRLDVSDRDEEIRDIVDYLFGFIDILYVIGGDGTMRAAHAIWTKSQTKSHLRAIKGKKPGRPSCVVGIPKTMDNDILWVWQAFGFLSAVEKAKEFIHQLHTEAKSNPRLCIVQLFGSDSGFVVSHAALASGLCKAALIPEVPFTMKGLSRYIRDDLSEQYALRQDRDWQSPYGIVLLAETAVPQDVEDYIDNPEYPDMGLEEREKEAIRKFVGSSLLNMNDIVDWKSLCDSLCSQAEQSASSLKRRIWDHIPGEIQGIIHGIARSFSENQGVKALVIKALNEILKKKDFYSPAEMEDVDLTSECREIHLYNRELDRLRTDMSVHNTEKLDAFKQRLSTLGVSWEAIAILTSIEEMRDKILADPGGNRQLIEEFKNRLDKLTQRVAEKFNRRLLEQCFGEEIVKSPSTLVARRIHGQTPDEIRTGGLKIVSNVLQTDIRNPTKLPDPDGYWKDYRIFKNEPRHLLRAIPPSVSDMVFGQRLGILAVDNAMAGYTDFMVSQWLTEYVLVPLKLVVLGRKRVPQHGIFWKSVLANTGQPADIVVYRD